MSIATFVESRVVFRGSLAWISWFGRLCEHVDKSRSETVSIALAVLASSVGFAELPPNRVPRFPERDRSPRPGPEFHEQVRDFREPMAYSKQLANPSVPL